jgi:hypothetical protein
MIKSALVLSFAMSALISSASFAQVGSANNTQCIGTGSFRTCTDYNSGNNYQIQSIGSSTFVNGTNSQTGSRWNQQTTKIGSSTIHSGTAANGKAWNITETQIGDNKIISGTDSNGKPVNCMITSYSNSCSN